ncbi:hypothetical protein LOAG_01727 [Loa loa]|uniref:Uncharacterized protein n=1 Tax=Loa loa TaxID=7209 RepID=A0A1S0U886_LOALO|nr:hypothetical protein LOAG_01727 [Loa loa]EFO26764.2 hypothetical protein LOAG_01727 [Loa loa]
MPFVQSYLCSFTNPCYETPTTGDDTAKINSDGRKQSLIVTIARGIAEMYVAIGSEPIKWANLSNSIISLVDIFAHFTPHAFQKPIPLVSFFNSTKEAVGFFKSTLNINDELSVNLSHARITPLYALEIIGKWLKFTLANNINMEYEELLEIFNTLRSFQNDQVIRKFISFLSIVDFSNYTSVINAIHCGNNPYDQSSHEGKSIPDATTTAAYNVDRDKIYDFLRRLTPRHSGQHKKKQFCGLIPIHSERNCSFLEGAALSQLMPLINGYILLAPASPTVDAFAEKVMLWWICNTSECIIIHHSTTVPLTSLSRC